MADIIPVRSAVSLPTTPKATELSTESWFIDDRVYVKTADNSTPINVGNAYDTCLSFNNVDTVFVNSKLELVTMPVPLSEGRSILVNNCRDYTTLMDKYNREPLVPPAASTPTSPTTTVDVIRDLDFSLPLSRSDDAAPLSDFKP